MDIDGLLGLVIFIFFLILLNGFFSSAEIAIISSKRSIIDKLSKEGNLSAQMVGKMKSDPERFLATVQVGVTFVSTLASVLAGVASSKYIEPIVLKIPYKPIHQFSETIAIFSIVIVIAYLTLVIGELVPKSIALRFAEKLAMFSARILNFVSKVSSPVIFILTTSTRIVLKTLGIKEQSKEVFVSEEEIKFYIKEGKASGVLEETEAALLHGVFEFSDITVKDVMVTKPKISAIDVSTPPEKILKKVVEDGYSRYPIYKDNVDHVEGILFNKDLFKAIEQEKPIVLKDIMREPYFVPDSIMISKLLRDMQKRKFHIAMVVNEHGDVDGKSVV